MGVKDKKKESKPSNPTNPKEKNQEPEKKGKGHKQKGAGTVIVSKGEVTVGGIVMKEWQRTPAQLVQEYCQKQKRPKPLFQNDRAPPGRFCVRVILPDSKNKEKDLVFSSTDSFPDGVLAKNCTCLLALHHLQPTLPLHQKLPEPYSSMWLKLTGSSPSPKPVEETPQFVCSICNRSFEKEMGLKVHMKKDHNGKKTVSEQTVPIQTTQPVVPSPPPTQPSESKPTRVIADHRNDDELKDLSLESKNHFTSKYDRMMAEERKRVKQSQYEKRKEIDKQLKRPPTVFLSEANQSFIQALLRQQEQQMNHGTNSTQSHDSIRKELEEQGFSTAVIAKALSVPTNLTAVDCIDWCCVHLRDSDLPPQYRSAGKQLDVTTFKKNDSSDSLLLEFGFEESAVKQFTGKGIRFEEVLFELLSNQIPSFQRKQRNEEEKMSLNEEVEALKAIYSEEVSEKWIDGIQLLQYTCDRYRMIFVLSEFFSYPQSRPIIFVITKEISKQQRLDMMKFIYEKYDHPSSGFLYEMIIDYDELIQSFQKQLLQILTPVSPLPVSKQPSKTIPVHHKPRVIEKSSLIGTPSPAIQTQRQGLPITHYKNEVLSLIHSNQISLVSGGTGCGKSTQVPQFLIENFIDSEEKQLNIVVCEPRRISCLGLYNRVLAEKGYTAGKACPVGYQVRGDSKTNANTVLTYCTTGVLLRQLQSETPDHITHIIVDEIHERSILSDFLLLLLKRIVKKNHTIKIILMSATMDQSLFASYFNTLASISVEGRLYPIEEHYLDDIVFDLRYQPSQFTRVDYGMIERSTDMESLLTQWCEKYQDYYIIPVIIQSIYQQQQPWKGGVVLVFLSGSSEIKNVNDILSEFFSETRFEVDIIQCHGSLSTQEQKRVFEDNPDSYRIVLATNIAETSITIPNCKYVIDTGKEKRVCYNADSHISEMKEVWVSKASAEQRKGRAGRVQDGIVYRLYTRSKYERLEEYTPPEMLRSPLDGICLQVLRMNLGNPDRVLLSCITPPSTTTIQSALDTLEEIQAIHKKEDTIELSPLGYHLADLPLDCRLGKILIFACLLRCVESVVTITAFLSQRSVFRAPLEKRDEMMARKRLFSYRLSDHLTLLRLFKDYSMAKNKRQFCYENFVNYESMLTISSMRSQFIQELQNIKFLPRDYSADSEFNMYNEEENVIKAALTAGMYSNVIKIEKTRIRYHRTIEGGSFESTPEAKEYRLLVNRVIEGCENRDGMTRVYIHPSSINFAEREYPYPFMIYTTILNTSKLFVHDTTVIPPYCLLLFAGRIAIQHLEGTLSVDDWLFFSAPARVGVLIQKLREYVDHLLYTKFANPQSSFVADPLLDRICSLLITNGLYICLFPYYY